MTKFNDGHCTLQLYGRLTVYETLSKNTKNYENGDHLMVIFCQLTTLKNYAYCTSLESTQSSKKSSFFPLVYNRVGQSTSSTKYLKYFLVL